VIAMKTTVKLKIADIIIEMRSRFPLKPPNVLTSTVLPPPPPGDSLQMRKGTLPPRGRKPTSPPPAESKKEARERDADERFKNFFYSGKKKPHIRIKVNIVDKLPELAEAKDLFITYHPYDQEENWRLCKIDSGYIYKSPLENKKQLAIINDTFDRVEIYLLPNDQKGSVWQIDDIIYDFLQVLLINYFALRREGIFIHSIGLKDLNGKGLLFAGKSGCGKSTTAKLWHSHSRAMVLNDDRVIARKIKGRFFIYGSPWHGDFQDYLYSRVESAALEKMFFIHHAPKNTAKRITSKKAFNFLYPALFPTFWQKGNLENIISFSKDLLKNVPCFRLGFVNNKKVIQFVRKI
jgi:hypothetical protein